MPLLFVSHSLRRGKLIFHNLFPFCLPSQWWYKDLETRFYFLASKTYILKKGHKNKINHSDAEEVHASKLKDLTLHIPTFFYAVGLTVDPLP